MKINSIIISHTNPQNLSFIGRKSKTKFIQIFAKKLIVLNVNYISKSQIFYKFLCPQTKFTLNLPKIYYDDDVNRILSFLSVPLDDVFLHHVFGGILVYFHVFRVCNSDLVNRWFGRIFRKNRPFRPRRYPQKNNDRARRRRINLQQPERTRSFSSCTRQPRSSLVDVIAFPP